MDRVVKKNDWYESVDSDVDYNELNKTNLISRYTNTINNNLNNNDLKLGETYKNLEEYYLNQNKLNVEKSFTTAETNDEHPIDKFNRIKKEIDLIEIDLEFYKKNKQILETKIPLDKALLELKNLKLVAKHLADSENFNTIKEIKEKNIKLEKDAYNILNKRIYEKLNEHLINKLTIINQLRSSKLSDFADTQYELYLTPDIQKIKLFTKLLDIRKQMNNIESRIGNWDIKSKRKSISEVVLNTNNHLRFFDKEFQKELESKLDGLNTRLKEIDENKEEFFLTMNKKNIDDLYNSIGSSRQIEDIIFKSVSKMESLKQNHEDSAFIHLKIKEISDQQDKIEAGLEENTQILEDVNCNINENLTTMKRNIEAIKKRIESIKSQKK